MPASKAGSSAPIRGAASAGAAVAPGRRHVFNPDEHSCAVCGDWGDEEGDYLFSCRECGLWVHCGCYGEHYFAAAGPGRAAALAKAAASRPAHAFTCAVCVAKLIPGTCSCKLCGRDVTINRAAKALVVSDPRKKKPPKASGASSWVHLLCATWSGETEYFNPEDKEHPRLLRHSVRVIGKCVICEAEKRKTLGRTVRCTHPGCTEVFHPICARENGWELVSKESPDGGVDLFTFCGSHTQKKHLEAAAACDEICAACQKGDRAELILLCDNCDQGWHTTCLKPPLSSIPEGSWFCSGCSQSVVADGASSSAGLTQRGKNRAGTSGAGALTPPPSKIGSARILGPDAELPNTFFVNASRKRLKPDDAPPVPPFVAMGASAVEDPMQQHWVAASAKADVEALISTYLPLLVGVRRAFLTVSSVGDALPAAWQLAAACAAAADSKDSKVMLVNLDDLRSTLPHADYIVVTGVSSAAPAAWRFLPDATLIIVVLQFCDSDLLRIPQHMLRGRLSVSQPLPSDSSPSATTIECTTSISGSLRHLFTLPHPSFPGIRPTGASRT